jgi:hypothetical protein
MSTLSTPLLELVRHTGSLFKGATLLTLLSPILFLKDLYLITKQSSLPSFCLARNYSRDSPAAIYI